MMPDTELADLAEAVQRGGKAVRADDGRRVPKPIKLRCPLAFGDGEEAFETDALLRSGDCAEALPQSRGDAIANAGDEPREPRDARQEYLVLHEARRSEVEKDGRARRAPPRPCVEPSSETKRLGRVEVAIPEAVSDLTSVEPPHLAPSIVVEEAQWLLETELLSDVAHDGSGQVACVGEERSEKAEGAQLNGASEATAHEGPILLVEVEELRELLGTWLPREAAVPHLLLGG